MNGMVNLGMNIEREGWKKYICERIQESGRRALKDSPRNEFCRWKCWCTSSTDGKGRMFARKRE